MIEFHNPEANVAVEPVPYDLALPVRGQSVSIALMANGFPDSDAFLTHLGEALRRLEPGIRVKQFNKGNPTIPASEEFLGDVTTGCAGVIAAYGH